MRIHQTILRRVGYGLLGLAMVFMVSLSGPKLLDGMGLHPAASVAAAPSNGAVQALLDQGRKNFLRGQLLVAVENLTEAQKLAHSQNDSLMEVLAWSNLGLVYGQLGDWDAANGAIASSLALLNLPGKEGPSWQRVRAQTLNVQGRLHLGQGDPEAAFILWGQAAVAYQAAGDRAGEIRSQLRQARALQAMALHRRAVDEILEPLRNRLLGEPPSLIKAASLRNLAEALTVANSLDQAQRAAEESLAAAETLSLRNEVYAAQLTLGNIEYARAKEYENQNQDGLIPDAVEKALKWYRLVSTAEDSGTNGLRSQLNELNLLIHFEMYDDAVRQWSKPYEQVGTILPDQEGIYTRINLAVSLEELAKQQLPGGPHWGQVLSILKTAQENAVELRDVRAEAHVLGYLGQVYKAKGEIEQDKGRLKGAKALTEKALFYSKTVNAADISFLWYEQLGDLQLELEGSSDGKNDKQSAIASYKGAVNSLKSLRSDLTNLNPEIRFSFQKIVDPLHRKLITLLLDKDTSRNQDNLHYVATVLESLQLQEVQNFLRADCLAGLQQSVDEVADDISGNERVAVIYPIILENQLGILAKLPEPASDNTSENKQSEKETDKGEFKFYSSPLDPGVLETTISKFRNNMVLVDYEGVQSTGRELYDLLFPEALLTDLGSSLPETLVFIPDGVLRNIPIAALSDGKTYLAEKYSVAVVPPGLKLVDAKAFQEKSLAALTFGLTESVDGFPPLPNVEIELDEIGKQIRVETYLNDKFTLKKFKQIIQASSLPIVHLATHGKFSSQLNETFIQAWDEHITVDNLSEWLRRDLDNPLELLVLSACETAAGDQRAALGLAGVAIRAGARSTLASLWQVDDVATSIFMTKFYEELSAKSGNKAAALRSAQQFLIDDLDFSHPYYWAPFVLLGNWL
ncbi:MAG: CHAT domain-containing protein [Leptolyngbyaceae cyanobacterium MO_188.B28]|nr:CHAT domain-containing protein [Leptolyngbyaceae cyanobacterium MO_188.B28]